MFRRSFDLLTSDFIKHLRSLREVKRIVEMLNDYRGL